MSSLKITAAAAITALSIGTAEASVIGFDHFNDGTQPAYSGHSEQGFDIQIKKGNWREAYFFGTSAPSIFSRSDDGKVTVKRSDGSGFYASSVNVGNGSLFSGSVKYSVFGKKDGTEMFRVKGKVKSLQAFNKVKIDDTMMIDRLVIRLFNQQAASFNIDDIAVRAASVAPTPVPVPASLPLMLGAGAVLMGLRRKT